MIRKLIVLIALSVTAIVSVSAQKKTEVLLKFSSEAGIMRIVFESEETFINRAKITTSASQIKIEFPEVFDLKTEKTPPLELVPSEKSLLINLPEKSEAKIFRLPEPARVVFDIQKKSHQPEKKAENQQPKEQKTVPLQAEKQPPFVTSRVIVIDAGHGGYDFGISSGDMHEKNISLDIAKELKTALSRRGKQVFLIRKVDQYVPLLDRILFVNQKRPDIFISLHVSASKNFVLYNPKFEERELKDLSDLYSLSSRQKKYVEKSLDLSESIGKAIKKEFGAEVVQRQMPLPLLNSVSAPCVVIEVPRPDVLIYDQKVRALIVNAIIEGLMAYG
ncbi:MAG: N-acetylmuramoyl-L-alanine amidase [Nitrospirota bacterium]